MLDCGGLTTLKKSLDDLNDKKNKEIDDLKIDIHNLINKLKDQEDLINMLKEHIENNEKLLNAIING
jgi:hypothetical protein